MLLGARGVGKRAAAAWLAQSRLQPDALARAPTWPLVRPEHPDLHWLTRLPEKHTIIIDQVRELIGDLSLTSHAGRGKVAVIEPANIMTNQAANSLLKTLEEPPGDALIVLVVDRMSRLPATILSRCQRMPITAPDTGSALEWLNSVRPGQPWAAALAEAGGAPLAAIDALERLDESQQMASELKGIAARRLSPVDVAERWTKQHPEQALDWLGRQVAGCIRRRNGGAAAGDSAVIDDSVLQRMDSRNLFCYLDTINRVRGQASGSYNLQLTLEGLLIDWAEGLVNCRRQGGAGGDWPLAFARTGQQ